MMCGICIESAYFSGDLAKMEWEPMHRLLQLMESPDWLQLFLEMQDPCDEDLLAAFAREVDHFYHFGSMLLAKKPSDAVPTERLLEMMDRASRFCPDPRMKVILETLPFNICDVGEQQNATESVLVDVANRYFVLPDGNFLRREGDWQRWNMEEEPYRFFWVYLSIVISNPTCVSWSAICQIPFLELRNPPPFSGWILWIQRRALARIVEEHGYSIMALQEPVRHAMFVSARTMMRRRLDHMESLYASLDAARTSELYGL